MENIIDKIDDNLKEHSGGKGGTLTYSLVVWVPTVSLGIFSFYMLFNNCWGGCGDYGYFSFRLSGWSSVLSY